MKEFTQPITNEQDVRAFFRHLLVDRKIYFHPDDDFNMYIDIPPMTKEEALRYNLLMEDCFDICGANVYDVANDMFNKIIFSQNEQ